LHAPERGEGVGKGGIAEVTEGLGLVWELGDPIV
jgi:hypothetical protein